MKLYEVLQPLFENKIEYIAKQQGEKIKAALQADSSVSSAPTDSLVIESLNTLSSISKKYLQWLVNRYTRNEFRLNEDLVVIAEALNVYEQWKKDIGPINNLSLPQLYDAIRPYKETNVDSEKERNLISSGQAEVIYDQGNERIIIPRTYAASEYFAKEKWGTSWCTKAKNMYEEYTENGPLYMIEINDGEEVYQVHWGSQQIMDRNDSEASPKHSKAFQWLIEKRKKEIENARTGDPSNAAYGMVENGYADKNWAKKVIENDKIGDPSSSAYNMVRDGHADSEWIKKIIENDKTGNPSGSAYNMVRDGHADSEWAKKIIENDKTGNPSEAAYWMVKDGNADSKWAKKVIENDKTGDPSYSAHEMVRDGHAVSEWARKIIENDKIGSPSLVAYQMVKSEYADSKWAMKVIESNKSGEPSDAAYWMVEDGYADKNWYEKVTGKKFK